MDESVVEEANRVLLVCVRLWSGEAAGPPGAVPVQPGPALQAALDAAGVQHHSSQPAVQQALLQQNTGR